MRITRATEFSGNRKNLCDTAGRWNGKDRHHLENLGFVQGRQIALLSELHGYYIVCIKDTKIGIEKHLAQKVILVA